MKLSALLTAGALCAGVALVAAPTGAQTRGEAAAAKRAAVVLTNTQPFGMRLMRGQGQMPIGRDLFNADPFIPTRVGPQITRLSAPAFAQVVGVRGSTLTLRTASGVMVGVRVPMAAVQRMNVRTGMQARLIPLNNERLTVQLFSEGPTAVCMTRIPVNKARTRCPR